MSAERPASPVGAGAGAAAMGQVGPWSAVAIVAGAMLGIGIFIGPPQMAQAIKSPGWLLALWVFGGAFAVAGALSVAELGAMLPQAGGDYPYLREAYGPGIAFAAGWMQVGIIFPGSIGTMAAATARYQLPMLLGDYFAGPITIAGVTIAPHTYYAAGLLLLLTVLNHVGVVVSGVIQQVLTYLPALAFLGVSLWVLVHHPTVAFEPVGAAPALPELSRAYLPVYFAYAGWYAALFVGGEVRRPARVLPLALIGGTAAVTLLYVVICMAFLAIFPLERLAQLGEAGTAAATTLFGPLGGFVIAAFICAANLGSLNSTILTGSRVAFAMALRRDCTPRAAYLDPLFRTPTFALWLQTAWSLVLIGVGKAEQLLEYTTSAMLVTGILTVMSVVRLRRRLPNLERPYRTWAYPVAPLLYSLSSLVVMVVLIADGDLGVLISAAWFVLSLLFYRYVLRPQRDGSS